MTLPLPLTLKARLRSRIRLLPEVADHDCETFGIWVRVDGRLVCKTCGRP